MSNWEKFDFYSILADCQEKKLITPRLQLLFGCLIIRTTEYNGKSVWELLDSVAQEYILNLQDSADTSAPIVMREMVDTTSSLERTIFYIPIDINLTSSFAIHSLFRLGDLIPFKELKLKHRELLIHFFHESPLPAYWPETVVEIGQSLYDGENCSPILHDVLLDIGLSEWAEHFTSDYHPKGCWHLDKIIGKR